MVSTGVYSTTSPFASGFGAIGRNTAKGRIISRWNYLEKKRGSWLSYWRDIGDYCYPRRSQNLYAGAHRRGNDRHGKIIDNKGILALRNFEAGMMNIVTPPTVNWFRLRTKDREMMKDDEIRMWLDSVEEVLRDMLNKSNFYQQQALGYSDLGAFGTSAMYREKDYESQTLHFKSYPIGQYAIAQNDKGRVDTLGRRYTMTVSQIVEKFLTDGMDYDNIDWTNASQEIQNAWREERYDDEFEVIQIIQPRRPAQYMENPTNMDMPFESVYIEVGGDKKGVLNESGYMKFPAYVTKWRVHGEEEYGDSPAMDCFGDMKQLQQQQRQKAIAIEKQNNPPVVADSSLRSRPASSVAGGITFVDGMQQRVGMQALYQINTSIHDLTVDMADVRQRISEGMFENLFMQFANNNPEGDKMTAAEVARRYAEQLQALTPMYFSLNLNLLSPMIKDLFEFAMELGMIPELPQALADADKPLDIEYTSIMAQAQEANMGNSIERWLSFVGNLAEVFPTITDNADTDKLVRKYAQILNVEADVLRKMSEVAYLREQRQEKMDTQEGAQMAQAAVQGAETLSKTDMAADSALTRVLGGAAAA